ncbi:MAG: hypothetical protein MSH60_00330 [Ruminococcus sp.]|nr:hypothetical protein [Ruminococcus sp.]
MAHSDKNYVLQSREDYTQKKYTVKQTRIVNSPVGNFKKGTVGRDTAEKESSNKKKSKALFKKALDESSSKKEEAAKKQKKSSYIKQNIQNDASAPDTEQAHNAYSEKYDDFESERASSDNDLQQNTDTRKSEEKPAHGSTKSDISASAEKDVTAKAEQMKKAAFIKERLQRNVAAAQMKITYCEQDDYKQDKEASDRIHSASTKNKDNAPLYVSEKVEESSEKEKKTYQSRYFGNTESISENKHRSGLENDEVKKAYKTKMQSDKLTERRMYAADMRSQAQNNAADMYSQAQINAALISAEKAKSSALRKAEAEKFSRDNVVPGVEMAAGYISAMKNGDAVGMITQPAVSIVKNHMGSMGKLSDDISTISGAVQNSDSIGGAATNAITSLAAVKIKSAVSNSLFKPSDEKIEKRLEKKFHYIDRKTDKKISRIQTEKENAMNGNISKGLEKKLDKIDRKQEQYREKLAKQQKELQRRQQKNIYIRHNRNNPAFVGGKTAKSKVMTKMGKGKMLMGAGSLGMFLIIIIIILILLMVIAQTLAPIGWLFGKPDSDPAMVDTDDLEKLCVSVEKVKKTYSDRIDFINEEISKAINDSEYWYEDEEGNLHISKGTAFAIAENEFWHYDSKETIKVGDAEIAKKIIDELPIPYKGENPERWAKRKTIYPEDFDADSASFVDLMNLDKMYEIISEDEFDFYEFCVYFQVYNIKKKYPEDSLEEHMDEMFELNDGKAYEFFEKRVKYKSTIYFAYHFATDTANGLPVYTGADPGMEQLAIRKFQNAQFWGFFNQCLCKGACYDNCRGHQVNMFILKIVPYSEIFDDEDITITEEDRKVIDQLKESMEILKTEIIPEVMETYSGTYFNDPENAETTTTTRIHADPVL